MHVDENLTLRSKFSFEILHVLFFFPIKTVFSLFLLFSLLDLFKKMNFVIEIISLLNICIKENLTTIEPGTENIIK